MKRKVNRVGQNTLTVSLPSKWAEKYNIKQGDEVEVSEDGPMIYISSNSDHPAHDKKITLDITGLDSSSILHVIQAAYRTGYDELILNFQIENTINPAKPETNKEERVMHAVQRTVNRLIGYEILEIKQSQCIIKNIAESDIADFDLIAKKTVFMFQMITNDLFEGIIKNNVSIKSSIQEQHDNLTKFISYCLRLISKSNDFPENKLLFYHLYSNIDKIVDIYKYLARELKDEKLKNSKDEEKILLEIQKNLITFTNVLLKFDIKKVDEMSRRRGYIRELLYDKKNIKQGLHKNFILVRLEEGLELLHDLNEVCIGLYLNEQKEEVNKQWKK